MMLGHGSQTCQQFDDVVSGQPVEHLRPLLAAADQAGLAQLLEVLRGVGNRQPRDLRQGIHAAFALGQELQQFQPVSITQRLADTRELGE